MPGEVFFKLWILHFKNMDRCEGSYQNLLLASCSLSIFFSWNLTIKVFTKYAWSKGPVTCSIVILKYFILNGSTWTRTLLFKLQLCSFPVFFFLRGTFILYIIFHNCTNVKHRDCFTTVTRPHCVLGIVLCAVFCFVSSCSLPNLAKLLTSLDFKYLLMLLKKTWNPPPKAKFSCRDWCLKNVLPAYQEVPKVKFQKIYLSQGSIEWGKCQLPQASALEEFTLTYIQFWYIC